MSDKVELLPCPFCGMAARLESNHDWHRIVVDHDEACIFLEPEVSMVPATDDQLSIVVADWNRRAALSQQPAPVAVPEPDQLPTDAMLDDMRRRGLSIDGNNAYKRDLIDCIIGTLMLGKQGINPPPAGHWAQQFWEMARAEGEIQESLAAASPAAPEPAAQEPAAWLWLEPGDELNEYQGRSRVSLRKPSATEARLGVQPLYTAPPAAEQPDTVNAPRELMDDDALEMKAREILAQEYERIGVEGHYPTYAEAARNGACEFTMRSIRAIKRALLAKEGV